MLDTNLMIQQTKNWITSFIIPLHICPFAKYVIDNNSIRFAVSPGLTEEDDLAQLDKEINYLNHHQDVETSFLIYPKLMDFFSYLDFVERAEKQILVSYEGIYQLATFHPDYCFANTTHEDAANYTNRSPYPMIHILREDSVEKAIAFYGDTEEIPATNIALLRNLGLKKIQVLITNSKATLDTTD